MGLIELAVRDLALIERARIELGAGLTVITGETGAGKSLLIDALTLVLGGRADSGLIRHEAERLRVEAVFEREPEPLICVREVSVNGRSVARMDDETVTVARLAGVAAALVEVHGQHEQQRLLSAAWQRDVLDAYGDHAELRSVVADAVGQWRLNDVALRELAIEPDELARRIELAQHAADEIESADPQPGEIERLRARLATLASSERIASLIAEAHALLAGERGARDQAALAERAAAELARLDGAYGQLSERLAGLSAELEDVAVELRRRQDDHAAEDTDAASIEERLGLLYGLLRKYGADEDAVASHGRQARAEAERLRGLDAERARRRAAADTLEHDARSAADRLSVARRATAARLAGEVTVALTELGFPEAAFQVGIEAAALSESGADDVGFLLAANPGEPARPLARIASGGEMSRVALAIKGVLARADSTPTLVFDEVDAGIGGRSADPVGLSLWRLGRSHQVICVTHLPQIAAHADHHLHIEKQALGGRTVTAIEPLDETGRVGELANMLGGGGSAAAVAAAQELLERARGSHREPAAA